MGKNLNTRQGDYVLATLTVALGRYVEDRDENRDDSNCLQCR